MEEETTRKKDTTVRSKSLGNQQKETSDCWHETVRLRNNPFHVFIHKGIYCCPHCEVDIATCPPHTDSISFALYDVECHMIAQCSKCQQIFKINLTTLAISTLFTDASQVLPTKKKSK